MKRTVHDERGASLILAVVFLVVVGAITGATLSLVTSGLNNRQSLDVLRDREYAADGAVNYAISKVRTIAVPGPALASCYSALVPGQTYYSQTLNGITIRVNCTDAPTRTFSGYLQRNVIFDACLETGANCTADSSIVRAQVNFQAVGSGATVAVNRTWIQSWSVNR